MPRRRVVAKRDILPDPKFGNVTLAKFMNHVMISGKKSVAERIVYGALDKIVERKGGDPLEVFEAALEAIQPMVEVKSRRVGGAVLQVPLEVKSDRGTALALRWLLVAARARSGRSMVAKLAAEIMDAANNTGGAIRKREDTHRMAEANKAFAHFRF